MEAFYKEGLIHSPPDILTLEARQTMSENPLRLQEGWGELSVSNLFKAIENRRRVPLNRFIYALGIPQVGQATAKLLAHHYVSYDAWRASMITAKDLDNEAYRDLTSINGIGPSVSEDLIAFFSEPHNLAVLDALTREVTVLEMPIAFQSSTLLSHKAIVFTGGLQSMSRAEAKARAEALGAKVTSSVSAKTDYVVIGDDPGSKAKQARELGVTCLTEEDWLKISKQESGKMMKASLVSP
jgi:DNA ligase (NAD+)